MTIDEAREKITDRYGKPLKKAKEKPTVEQSVLAWDLLNELIELGYCHSFQYIESHSWVLDFLYSESAILDKALKIRGNKE